MAARAPAAVPVRPHQAAATAPPAAGCRRRGCRVRRPAPRPARFRWAAPGSARRRRARTASASARAPRTGRSSPASDSSPANSKRSRRSGSICPAAARMPSAIGRSKRPDSLGRSAGARLTVMRLLCGKAKPLCASAARTRSRDSFTSVSARPTSVKLGRPLARCTSTVTGWACRASSARLWTTAKDMALHHASAVRRHWLA